MVGDELMPLAVLPIRDGTPTVLDADFLKNILEVEFDRIKADLQNDGNFPVGFSGRDPPQNFFFAPAESRLR